MEATVAIRWFNRRILVCWFATSGVAWDSSLWCRASSMLNLKGADGALLAEQDARVAAGAGGRQSAYALCQLSLSVMFYSSMVICRRTVELQRRGCGSVKSFAPLVQAS